MTQPPTTRATIREWTGLIVLVLPCLVVSMDGHVLDLAIPKISASLHPSGAQLLWIIDGYVFFVAGALLAMGAIGDRIGRRRLLLIGATLFAGGSLAAAFASSPIELIVGRALMGLSGASLMPSTLSLIRGMFADDRQRTTALGVWSASFSLGGLAGPLIGGALLDRFWWGSVFLLSVPITLLLLIIGPRILPEFCDPNAARFDVVGAMQSVVALLAIVYGIKRVAEQGNLAEAAAVAAAGLALAVAFVRRQRRRRTPMIDPHLFRARPVRLALISGTVTFFALYGTNVVLAQYLQWILGLSPLQAGLWTVPSVFAYLIGTACGPLAVSRFSRVQVLGVGLAACATGCALFTLVLAAALNGLAVLVTATVVFAFGLAPVYTMSTDLVVANTRPERAGAASAVAETGAELGGALGIALLGSLGVSVYRLSIAPTPGLPPDALADARRTLGDAIGVAASLPGQQAQQMLQHAYDAFRLQFAAMGATAALIILTAFVSIIVLNRRQHRAEQLQSWINGDPAEHLPPTPSYRALTDPALTGMSRDQLHTLLERLIVSYAAAIEQRRHRHRGGDRRPGSRAGVFRQKITDGDRILATILYRRRVCRLDTLADLFAISRSTLWSVINDVSPILDGQRITIVPADHRHATTAELLASVTAADTTEPAC